MKITLTKPVQFGDGAPITEITLREEMVAGDLRGIKASSLADPTFDDLLKIAGRLCSQPDGFMPKLGLADMTAVLEVVGDFLNAGMSGTKPQP